MFKYCALLAISTQLFGFEFYKTKDGQTCKWDLSSLPDGTFHWKVADGAPDIARQSMLFATQAWSDASAGVLRFTEGDGGIVVNWGGLGADVTALAQTTLSARNGTILSAKIVVNTGLYSWIRGPQTAQDAAALFRTYDLDPVLLHEMGHALGLDHSDKDGVQPVDHSDLPTMNSIVYPCARTLHIDDITGIRVLYGIDAPLPQLTAEASPPSGQVPFTAALFQQGGDEFTHWDFGDGTESTGASATHRYRTPGHYEVSVSVNGMKTTLSIDVTKKQRKKRAPHNRH